jgi:2-polyprenyl-3-methyl-5-hydroxy-6-metoxy-1,4-benzoquinol methylase
MASASFMRPFFRLAAPVKMLMHRFPRFNAVVWNTQYRLGVWNKIDSGTGAPVVMLLEKYFRDPRILDLGCGRSINLRLPPGSYRHYHGVDISRDAIATARTHARPNSSFEVADILGYNTDERYDAILLREVVYCLPAQKVVDFLQRIARFLDPDGKIFIQIWNKSLYAESIGMVRNSGLRVVEQQTTKANRGPEGIVIVIEPLAPRSASSNHPALFGALCYLP